MLRKVWKHHGAEKEAAILGIAAAGESVTGYRNANEIAAKLGKMQDKVYTPAQEQSRIYDDLYADYLALHEYFGKGGSDVKSRLNHLRRQ
ncbi:MAG: hypothetical protein IJ110_03900 [Lachnospiraceae bacterium]|nr:hypothetical protein [Lachnospiraceae bacterium]